MVAASAEAIARHPRLARASVAGTVRVDLSFPHDVVGRFDDHRR